MEIMLIIENAENEIEFLEKLNEMFILENKIREQWLAKIIQNTKNIEKLKSRFNEKIKDLENWCLRRKSDKSNKSTLKASENEKIESLLNKLSLISELIKNNFEAKHLFQIENGSILIYGIETRKICKIKVFPYKTDLHSGGQAIELPNNEIFCIWNFKFACKIDLKTSKIVKKFRGSSFSSYYPLIYYDNCVYAFSEAKDFEKYDLIKNIKTTLPSHSIKNSSNFTCCVYRNSILFCTEYSVSLFKFEFLIESYSRISLNWIESLSRKSLFTGNARAYIYDSMKVLFESGIDNEYSWSRIIDNVNNFIVEEINQSIGNFLYFPLKEHDSLIEVYKFDIPNTRLHKIATKDYQYDGIYQIN